MNGLFNQINDKWILHVGLVYLLILSHGTNLVMADNEESKTSKIMCAEYNPQQFRKNCIDMDYKAIEIDTVIEVKSPTKFNLCNKFIMQKESTYSFREAEENICSIRQRPDLIFNYTSESVKPDTKVGWRFINRNLLNCDEAYLASLITTIYAIYYCHGSSMVNYRPQNEIAVDEDMEMVINSMKKIYISNIPAVAEAYESRRNPIWHRLENDHSLFSEAKRHYCNLTMYNETTVMFTGSGALFESIKTMDSHEGLKDNMLTLKKNASSELWIYKQNVMENSHIQYTCNSNFETFLFQYSDSSPENMVVFAVPVRVITGTIKIKCGILAEMVGAIILPPNDKGMENHNTGPLAGAIIGTILAVFIIVTVLVIFLKYRKRKRKRQLEISNVSLSFQAALGRPVDESFISDTNAPSNCHLPQASPTSANPLLNQNNPFSRQYTLVNGFRRKISTYSSRDENIYCDLDDFHVDNGNQNDNSGGASNDNPTRRSATIMINNGMYEVNNDQKCVLLENGKHYGRPHPMGKDSGSSDSERDSINAKNGYIYNKRTSVVKMVDNEMYCSSDEDDYSVGLSNNSESDSLNEQLSIKRVPESFNGNDKMASSSVKLPAKRCLSKVEEQSETSSSSEDEGGSINNICNSKVDSCENENPYLISSNNISTVHNTTANENPYLVSSRNIPKESNNSDKSVISNQTLFPSDNQNNLFDRNDNYFSSIPSLASCQSISSVDDIIDIGFDEVDGPFLQSPGEAYDPYEVPSNLHTSNNKNNRSAKRNKDTARNETKINLPVKIISSSSSSESDDSQSSHTESSSLSNKLYNSKIKQSKPNDSQYEMPNKTLSGNKNNRQYDADISSVGSSTENNQRLSNSFKHKRRRKSRTKHNMAIDDIKLPVGTCDSHSSDNQDQPVKKDSCLQDLYQKPNKQSPNIQTKQMKDSDDIFLIKLPMMVHNESSSDSENSFSIESGSQICDTENPYEVSCDKRPSIVQMVDNEVYSSGSSDSLQHIPPNDKRPSITIMVQNEVHVPSSDENEPLRPKNNQRGVTNENRRSVSVKADNYINTNLRDNKGRKVRYKRDYEVINENMTSSEDELVVTKL